MKAKRANGAGAGRGLDKVRVVAKADLPTQYGRFTILGIEGGRPEETAVVLTRGRLNGGTVPLVRIHSQCLTGDVLGSQRCDCRAQLELSLRKIAAPRTDVTPGERRLPACSVRQLAESISARTNGKCNSTIGGLSA